MYSIEGIEWRKHFRGHVLVQWLVQMRLLGSRRHLAEIWSGCCDLELPYSGGGGDCGHVDDNDSIAVSTSAAYDLIGGFVSMVSSFDI